MTPQHFQPARTAQGISPALFPRVADLPLLLAYMAGFGLLHISSAPWAGGGFFSLWYPAAGLRFAVLWHRGVRMFPWLILCELTFDHIFMGMEFSGPGAFANNLGAARPGITYAIAIAAVRYAVQRRDGTLALPPMTLGLAAIGAPMLNALLIIPIERFMPFYPNTFGITVDMAIALTGLAVGDLLGILVVAPLLLWLAGWLETPRGARKARIALPSAKALLLDGAVLLCCLIITGLLWRAGLGAQPAPLLLAGAWIGLRHGRIASWLAIIIQIIAFLPFSAGEMGDAARLELHMSLASIVIVTWLAGSFSDAQKTMRKLLERRNRLLFQAERLKTLRAMSVAVIHEISQPLSTLAIEAGHLAGTTQGMDADIAESAALVDRKARALSDLVRRLRRFGGRDVDAPSALPLAMLLQTATQIVAAEARAANARITMAAPAADLLVQAQEIELTQALVNLLRNAIAASPGQTVRLTATRDGEEVCIAVASPFTSTPATTPRDGPGDSAGMGIGLVISRTIVEAHGGTLTREDHPQEVRFLISLPVLAGHTP